MSKESKEKEPSSPAPDDTPRAAAAALPLPEEADRCQAVTGEGRCARVWLVRVSGRALCRSCAAAAVDEKASAP